MIKNPNSQILAVEANPKNFETLKSNIYINNLSNNVKVFNYVVTSEPGLQPFYLSSNSGWSSIYSKRGAKNGKMIHVEPISLSGLFKKSYLEIVDLLKIDIGLYPLLQEEWVLGKSGLKTMQYMSLGIPSISSERPD